MSASPSPSIDSRGPWWVTSFVWQGRACVIRFRLDAALEPSRIELLSGVFHSGEPSRALKRHAARAFVALHRPLIEIAYEIGGDIEKARAYCRAQGYLAGQSEPTTGREMA